MTKLKCIFVQTIVILEVLVMKISAKSPEYNSTCTNPNGRKGSCVLLNECTLLSALNTKFSKNINFKNFLRISRCGSQHENLVCCPFDTGNTTTPFQCNITDINEARIFRGNNSDLRDSPWLVSLEYYNAKMDSIVYGCGGNIITKRFVLTAAHCVDDNAKSNTGNLLWVLAGGRNLYEYPECNDYGCPDAQRLEVDNIIIHPRYYLLSYHDDIALIKTKKNIVYTELVKPICLPDIRMPRNQKLREGTLLQVSGWGLTEQSILPSLKQKLDVFYIENINCVSWAVTPRQLCTIAEMGKTVCSGDSGGGLVRQPDNRTWTLEGIVSYTYKYCVGDFPNVFTRVSEYIPWILDNVKSGDIQSYREDCFDYKDVISKLNCIDRRTLNIINSYPFNRNRAQML